MPFRDRTYRSTTSSLSPLYFAAFRYSDTPRLTTRTTNMKLTHVVEVTSTESEFGLANKKSWRTEVETSTTETFE